MTEQVRDNYFLAVRMGILLVLPIYIAFTQSMLTGASGGMLLLLAFLIGTMAGKELFAGRIRYVCLIFAGVLCGGFIFGFGTSFVMLFIFYLYEFFSALKLHITWYFLPFVFACIPSDVGMLQQLLVSFFLFMIYLQHDFIISSYRKQTKEETAAEQKLKHNMQKKENQFRKELIQSALLAENRLLEERARLTQILHDKLGHNINGSIYQLEASKLLLFQQPETAQKMIQAVIDELRNGMDEIRAILRRERPEKYRFAMIRLQDLCEECQKKGVDAELVTEGEMADVPKEYLEIILDNAFEAVSNSLKYAKCTKILIKIYVLNQMIRCSISDNGIGCENFTDGMGIEGMRHRMREVNGILDFETEAGFTINMLFPL